MTAEEVGGLIVGIITALAPIIMAIIALVGKRSDEEREWRERMEAKMAEAMRKVDSDK